MIFHLKIRLKEKLELFSFEKMKISQDLSIYKTA